MMKTGSCLEKWVGVLRQQGLVDDEGGQRMGTKGGTSVFRSAAAAFTVLLVVGMAFAPGAVALTLNASHSVSGGTFPADGGTVDVTVLLTATGSGSLLALGVTETIPSGWSYNSFVSGPALLVQPSAGATGTLNFAWGTVPPFPVTFVYRLNVPAGGSTTQTISGSVSSVDGEDHDQQTSMTDAHVSPDHIPQMPLRAWPVGLAVLLVGAMVVRSRTGSRLAFRMVRSEESARKRR